MRHSERKTEADSKWSDGSRSKGDRRQILLRPRFDTGEHAEQLEQDVRRQDGRRPGLIIRRRNLDEIAADDVQASKSTDQFDPLM